MDRFEAYIDAEDPRYVVYGGRRMLRVIGAEYVPPLPSDPAEPAAADPAPDPTPPAADPPAANPGPWAADLEQRFEDPAQRAAVDQYLREVVQPRITQLEQRPDLPEGAAKLWSDLNGDDYATAYLGMTAELFDPEVAQEVLQLLTSHYGETEPTAPAEPAADPPPTEATPPARDPEVEEIIRERQQNKYNAAIDDAVSEQKDAEGNVTAPAIPEVFRDLIHPIVSQNGGDIAAAATALREKLTAAGVLGAPTPGDVPDVPEPPPTTTAAVPPAVPVQSKQSLEEAITDFWNESRKQPPPTVGGV